VSAVLRSTAMVIALSMNFATLAPAEPLRYGAFYSVPDHYRDLRAFRYPLPPIQNYGPPVIIFVPMRPASCGQYRYWDGERCADARFDPPYVGPRW
jgi:hypothetical protein